VRTIFALASGRSGTHFLYEVLRRNATDCICRHETYSWSNPSMFGRPIYDHAVGNHDAVRRQAEIKARWIFRQRAAAYIETSHAFCKSWYRVAPDLFPDLWLIHLVRDVLHVAKSEANREELIHRWKVPFRFARGDGGFRFFRWALTGREPVFRGLAHQPLTRFQWYVVQWIEIENRAMQMLDEFRLHDRCITLHSPTDLNDPQAIAKLLAALELKPRGPALQLSGGTNRTPGVKTVVTDDDRWQAAEVIAQLPASALAIFGRRPYVDWPWTPLLRPSSAGFSAQPSG
jgi:hypothetical protein